jgi:hypothetical protein
MVGEAGHGNVDPQKQGSAGAEDRAQVGRMTPLPVVWVSKSL